MEIFPPLPQNYEVPESYLSPHMQKVRDDLKITKEGQKLICDLGPKKNYVISAYTLKTYLRAGVKITGDYNKIYPQHFLPIYNQIKRVSVSFV